ncbi:MAG TPA: hypothetical protein VK171_11835 [Fimbriimonas sp.]|nr:hypothetical protein [Fimbriimonas sp.]
MRPFWKFAKPTGPGFGINKNFYLTVLSTHPGLPAIANIANPKGQGGAVEAFGVPLVQGNDKRLLEQPMQRGKYAIASKDRKTVINLTVAAPQDAGFSGQAIASSLDPRFHAPALIERLQRTTMMLQFRFESHDPDVYPALDLLLTLVKKCGTMTDAVVADPLSERYLLPDQVFLNPRLDPLVDCREHIFVHEANGRIYTKGMSKILQSDFLVENCPDSSKQVAGGFLVTLAQAVFMGHPVTRGQKIGGFTLIEFAPNVLKLEPEGGSLEQALQRGIL